MSPRRLAQARRGTDCKASKLTDYDGIIIGAPTRYGNMAVQMRSFLDQTGRLWSSTAMVGKAGSVFTSTAGQNGGQEMTLIFHLVHGTAPGLSGVGVCIPVWSLVTSRP